LHGDSISRSEFEHETCRRHSILVRCGEGRAILASARKKINGQVGRDLKFCSAICAENSGTSAESGLYLLVTISLLGRRKDGNHFELSPKKENRSSQARPSAEAINLSYL